MTEVYLFFEQIANNVLNVCKKYTFSNKYVIINTEKCTKRGNLRITER